METQIAEVFTGLFIILTLGLLMKELIYEVEKVSNINDVRKLVLAPIGVYKTSTGREYNLDSYFLDSEGTLYSMNPLTWEVKPQASRDILICSDDSFDNSGKLVNSMRDDKGNKVTVRRSKLKFTDLKNSNGIVELKTKAITPRHLKITKCTKFTINRYVKGVRNAVNS